MDGNKQDLEQKLLTITQDFLRELGASRALLAINMQAKLDQELGIGSLEKAELMHRIEQEFNTKLPESLLAEAKTLSDIFDRLIALPHAISKQAIPLEALPLAATQIDLDKLTTLNDVIRVYAELDATRPAIYFQQDDVERVITYGYLYQQALKIAGGLSALGVKSNDTIALMLPSGEDFFFAFYGILFCGAIPVPIYPPMRLDQIEEYINKEAKILFNAGIKVLISFKEARALNKILKPFIPTLTHITDINALLKSAALIATVEVSQEDIALLQYTSGSTGNPKGVVLTHANLLANIRAYGDAVKLKPNDVIVSWLPLYHDMGLIGAVMGSLFYGIPLVLMSPITFLMRPEKWLWAIHYRRGTLSAAPNFAYELCVQKIKDQDIIGIDLSSWRVALNGAEAIAPQTLARFTKRFSKYGFSKTTFFPAYGLAESAVALSFPPVDREPIVDYVDQHIFEVHQKAVPASLGDRSYGFVSCGFALPGHEIRIVDDEDNPLRERQVGNLQFRGPSSMQGYYRNNEATKEVYHDGWWATGDLAYIADNELYITGRKKDLIIKAGRNYYPPEIEEATSLVLGVRKGCVAAFGIAEKQTGTEKLIIVVEKDPKVKINSEQIIAEITEKVTARIGIPPDEVVLVSSRVIPKTSSGKLRRFECKKMYEYGHLGKERKSVARQLVRLFFRGSVKRIRKFILNIGKLIYTIYATCIVLLILIPVAAICFFQNRDRAASLIKKGCRAALFLAFCPVKCNGEKNITPNKTQIFVANHTSYADAVILLAILPTHTRFVGKKELLKAPLLGFFMKKLECIFVDRMDISQNDADMQKMREHIQQGCSLLFFPEGTFTRVAGVRPFKIGPYKLSVSEGVPITPIAICNARHILRADQFLLAPKKVKVTVIKGRLSKGKEWQDMVYLRDWSRQQISHYCGEEPIDLIVAGPEYRN